MFLKIINYRRSGLVIASDQDMFFTSRDEITVDIFQSSPSFCFNFAVETTPQAEIQSHPAFTAPFLFIVDWRTISDMFTAQFRKIFRRDASFTEKIYRYSVKRQFMPVFRTRLIDENVPVILEKNIGIIHIKAIFVSTQ
eukprot:TRINITY_DN22077_c0_g1_i1.p3 TRINITY_DN22077_c0_g1~~TRINITY_DN22077_c0_g1_i1.p3  ORF type:complete len:139 (-),score=2.87 TRINITY_DN22077_c0_g1_i1:697-1113(-)